MKAHRLLCLGAATIAALATLTVAATSASAATSVYHPAAQARTFAGSPGGWTSGTGSGGPCVIALLCPTVGNPFVSTGGAGGAGDGYLRSSFGPLLGVAGERSAIWRSPSFEYDGAKGQFPDALTFNLDRRGDVDALLSVASNDADFRVELVGEGGGKAIDLTGPLAIDGAPNWTAIPTAEINPNKLEIGARYYLRITTRIAFGVDVLEASTADYDNVVLTAFQDNANTPSCATPIFGTAGPDRLTGSNGGDRIKAFKGNDKVFGLRGPDCLYGGPGKDLVSGSDGPDEIHGNDGDDALRGGNGKDKVIGGTGADKIRGVAGNDLLKGGADDDSINGAKGADELHGGGGDDTLKGGADPDRLVGGSGKDVIGGFAGNDRIKGGAGADRLSGGGGRDTITGGSGKDKIKGGGGRDTIKVRGLGKDKVNCGGGRDRVVADRKDKIGRSCERVRYRG